MTLMNILAFAFTAAVQSPAAPPAAAVPPPPAAGTPPVPLENLGSLVRVADYPLLAARQNRQGRVYFILTVSPDGRVSNCVVTRTSRVPSLDVATCRIMRGRARFTPARDAQGNPVEGTYETNLGWTLGAGASTENDDN